MFRPAYTFCCWGTYRFKPKFFATNRALGAWKGSVTIIMRLYFLAWNIFSEKSRFSQVVVEADSRRISLAGTLKTGQFFSLSGLHLLHLLYRSPLKKEDWGHNGPYINSLHVSPGRRDMGCMSFHDKLLHQEPESHPLVFSHQSRHFL